MHIGRTIGAVLAGAIAWAILWLGGTAAAQAAFPTIIQPDQPLTHMGALLSYILYSVGLSILAGFTTAAAAGRSPMPAVWILCALQLTLGVIAEVSYWSLLPVWYHLVFLALIVPATAYGGQLQRQRQPAPA